MSILKTHLESLTPEEVYLNWLNDWISTERMAEFYNVERYEIELLINKGRNEHLNKFESEAYKKVWIKNN